MFTTKFSAQYPQAATHSQSDTLLLLSAVFALGLGFSTELAALPAEKGGDGWTVELGMGSDWEATFAGSENRQLELSPYLNVAYRNGKTLYYTTVLDYGVYHSLNERWIAGASAGIEFGRAAADDSDLRGLGNIENTYELRFDLAYQASENLKLAGRAMTAGADKDNVYFIAALYEAPLDTEKFELRFRSDISWGSQRHLQTEFGVTPTQSSNSTYAAYHPKAGIKSIGVAVAGRFNFSKHWFGFSEISYEKYGDAGADSPFVDNDYDVEAEVGFAYQF